MDINKIRDLSIIKVNEELNMVIACDSCGAIGLKEEDVLKVPPFYTGAFTARVGIMEVKACGAEVVTLVNNVCCEMNPTGKEIIRGIKSELKKAKIDEVVLTGSTEENFYSKVTALGITVIGMAKRASLKINNIKENCELISIGVPKVGDEINLDDDSELVDYETIDYLQGLQDVFEIVPVGSKGILYEAETLAKNNGYKFNLYRDIKENLRKSSGPATCVIAAVTSEGIDKIKKRNCSFISILGQFVK